MLDRIIDISLQAPHLRVENSLLVIELHGEKTTIPLEEIGVLVFSNPAISLTNAVLSQIASNGGMIVCIDGKYLPAGMLLPMQAHCQQSEKFQHQVASAKLNKKLWQEIIIAKIKNQLKLLTKLKNINFNEENILKRVLSDDKNNVEAQIAKLYWKNLAIIDTRSRYNYDANILLNYGYTILHAICARAICAAGLHPTLGIHHHHQSNSFCLASDIMEPFRVIFDNIVYEMISNNHIDLSEIELSSEHKKMMISAILQSTIKINNKQEKIIRAVQITASSLAKIYCQESKKLLLPEFK